MRQRTSPPNECIQRVIHRAESMPLALDDADAYGDALRELELRLCDCIGWRPDTCDRAWRDVLATWQRRHIDAAMEGTS